MSYYNYGGGALSNQQARFTQNNKGSPVRSQAANNRATAGYGY